MSFCVSPKTHSIQNAGKRIYYKHRTYICKTESNKMKHILESDSYIKGNYRIDAMTRETNKITQHQTNKQQAHQLKLKKRTIVDRHANQFGHIINDIKITNDV